LRGPGAAAGPQRIHVRYLLTVDADVDLAVVERVPGLHADKCPAVRSIRDAIAISTEVVTVREQQHCARGCQPGHAELAHYLPARTIRA